MAGPGGVEEVDVAASADPERATLLATVRVARALAHALANRMQVIEGVCHLARTELPLDRQPLLEPVTSAVGEMSRLIAALRQQAGGDEVALPGGRVLVIDTDVARREALACLLEGLGHHVSHMGDARTAGYVDDEVGLAVVGGEPDAALDALLAERGWPRLELTSHGGAQAVPLIALAAAIDERLAGD